MSAADSQTRRRRVSLVVTLLAAVALADAGCGAPHEALTALRSINVRDYSKAVERNGRMEGDTWSRGYFIGPATPNVLQNVTGDGLTIEPAAGVKYGSPPVEPKGIPAQRDLIAEGKFLNGCRVTMWHEIQSPEYEAELTSEQISELRAGTSAAYSIHVTCGTG
ncbi:hypothetical protein ACWEQ0_14345 [Nocardia thailandica]